MKAVIINVNLEYQFDVETDEEAIELAENLELPKEYVEDSFDIVKVITISLPCHICKTLIDKDELDENCAYTYPDNLPYCPEHYPKD